MLYLFAPLDNGSRGAKPATCIRFNEHHHPSISSISYNIVKMQKKHKMDVEYWDFLEVK